MKAIPFIIGLNLLELITPSYTLKETYSEPTGKHYIVIDTTNRQVGWLTKYKKANIEDTALFKPVPNLQLNFICPNES